MMTREEAITILQEKYDYCKSFYDLAARPKEDYAETAQYLQALQVALTALRPISREQVEKVWGSEWIDCSNGWMCSRCENDNTYAKPFCPSCGAAMKDEAVNMVMERMEELKVGFYRSTSPNDYCSYFEPKEDMEDGKTEPCSA